MTTQPIEAFSIDESAARTPEFPSRIISETINEANPWSLPNSPRGQRGSTEFSLEYLPNPMEVIDELNKIKVQFTFDDEQPAQARKRRATIARGSRDSTCSDINIAQGEGNEFTSRAVPHPSYYYGGSAGSSSSAYHHWTPLSTIPNERMTIQSELLDRLEKLAGVQDCSNNIPQAFDDGQPRLGIYTEEERIERINAYREKRKQRVFGKVRYVLRKRASEGRSRVKGRFAKEESSCSADTPTAAKAAATTMVDEEIKDSASWLEKMTIGARRLSNSFAPKKRSSVPARPTSPPTELERSPSSTVQTDAESPARRNSWSSWLLTPRRKSSTSTNNSNSRSLAEPRQGGSSASLTQQQPSGTGTPPLPPRSSRSPSHQLAAATFLDMDVDDFIIEHLGEPDRKRLTSGSSALFNELIIDPLENEVLDGEMQ